jgi:FAD dependent oxidoreductase
MESLGDFDVVIVGAGSAGASAAIASARSRARTLLIDRLPFVGGTSTGVLDTFYGFYTPGERSNKIIGGIPDEVVEGLRAYSPVLNRPNTYGAGTGITYNPEYLKVVWESLIKKSGAKVLLHSLIQEVEVRDGAVTSVILATRAGLRRVSGRFFIDASGDGDLSHFASFGYEKAGEIAPAQTLTTTFRMVNVDTDRRKEISKDEFHRLMAEAAESGYHLPRKEGSDHITPVPDTTATVMTRLDSVRKSSHGSQKVESVLDDPYFLSESEMEGRAQALEYARFLFAKVPGYENASLYGLSTFLGIRETRRVYGDYRVTKEDVIGARKFDDQIGLCGAPIEDHHSGSGTGWEYIPNSDAVGIPLRSLFIRDSQNTMVVGRCFSATHDAHASIRSMGQCMAMGVAAGTMAGLVTESGREMRSIPLSTYLPKLTATGAILEMPQ